MKKVSLPFGKQQILLDMPDSTDVLSAVKVNPLPAAKTATLGCLNSPIASAPLHQLARDCKSAAVVVSDNTRPVPYKGPDGILPPIIETLKNSAIKKITIIIACGTHRPMTDMEIREMLGESIFEQGIEIINHIATDDSMLRLIGSTERTPKVTVNRHYLDADLKIITGLVEPHFMAGFSGGRKAVCPGICGQDVTYGFHSASILISPHSTSLKLEGNPCHEESLHIAKMAGVDFAVNVTIDSQKHLTGVFCGELEKAHETAVEHLNTYATIGLDHFYDTVITQAGDVGVNHYQCAKAAVEASRAVGPGGCIIIAGNLSDPDPVGGNNYKEMLKLLTKLGAETFIRTITSNDWEFIPEQWQAQMWAGVFKKLGSPKKFLICAPQLENYTDELIPEVNMSSEIKRKSGERDPEFTQRMMQQTIDRQLKASRSNKVLLLPDGPYAVPIVAGEK